MFKAHMLVIGGGMGGMTSAALAAQRGLTVLVAERAPDIGGSAALSEGYVWTAPSLDAFLEQDPAADAVLAKALINGHAEALEWIRSAGIEVGGPLAGIAGYGVGAQIDVGAYFRWCRRVIEAAGGWVFTGTETERLLLDSAGAVRGAVAVRQGETATVRARHTVLATGGFQANGALVRKYIRGDWDPVLLRSNTFSTGGGILLGSEAGAGLAGNMKGFYGHLMPSPLARPLTELDYTALAQYHSEHGILVNRRGRRFCDESLGDHANAMAVARQQDVRALLICDEWIRREQVMQAFIPGMERGLDKFAHAAAAGARVAQARSEGELARAVSEWGYAGPCSEQVLLDFNNDKDGVRSMRRRNRRPLNEPPLFAIEVQPAITFTYGGLRTEENGRVLRPDGSAITGLYAVGADMGGVYYEGFAGGLVRGLVFGRRVALLASASSGG